IFKKTKWLIKKFILTNFFIFSIIIWYSQINDSLLTKDFWVNLNPCLNIENIVYDNQSIISYNNLVQDNDHLI
mgnify:CR=1